ncbi:Mg-protoporphyrin IX monomethyl ester oxidative cyclase [Enhygromyxa salina]|uniref:Mg-protoporphyrin IX monomethyl ester oxidative cyclase n=1 Tax=Enhygromyxa salina TaxID=215803 RepID=A0A0C2D0Z3_9BACT|nr:cobalamin-dependent protein [Enhygromyxa salina]KIG15515.1 Mg-protoporphyrin IX monomethyl ester oxidative cyclase [Enhygromyxa salina]
MQRRIVLVAVDAQWRDPNGTFFSFSYGIEKLRAAIVSAPDLADTEILLLDLLSGDADHFFEAVRAFQPTLVGLSTYVWSLNIFAELTRRLREHQPDLVIVAGGPSARRSVLDLPQYHPLRDRVDAVIPGEGEEVIRQLVRHHQEPDWRKRVGGLQFPTRGLWRSSEASDRPAINEYPSPYQLDLAPLRKTGYVETFRGCPIHCAFCQWGEQKSDRVHDAKYLQAHLEGLRRANVPNVFFLDAAFNLSPRAFRALVAAEDEVGVLADSIVHGHLYPTFLEDHHLEFFDRIKQVQASIGIQSFDVDVLERLGRPFDVARFEKVLGRIRGRLNFDIELIFGLPGDRPDSFRRTVERSLELGDTVKAFKCLVLPDALLERAADLSIEYDPETFQILSCEGWTADDLAREWEWLYDLASQADRPILNDDWVGFAITTQTGDAQAHGGDHARRADGAGRSIELTSAKLPDPALSQLRDAIAQLAAGWGLEAVRGERGGVFFDLHGPQGAVVLEVVRLEQGARYFAERDGLAYSHRGPVDRASSPGLRRVIDLVHAEALSLVAAS